VRASGSGEVYTETSTVKILLCGDSLSVKVKRKEAKEFELTIEVFDSLFSIRNRSESNESETTGSTRLE